MNQRIDWALWQSFLAVANTGSLSAAARTLGMTQPTLGRHIDLLEAKLGRALFVRTPHGLSLTDTAAMMVTEAQAMQMTADSLARLGATAPETGNGTVRIAASHVVGTEVLPIALSPLLRDYPGLSVELALSNESADLMRREADMAVRMVRPSQGTLVARRLGDLPLGLFAHRNYLDRVGRPTKLEELKRHTMIGPDRDAAGLSGLDAFGKALGRMDLRLRADSEAAQIASVRAGLGVGVLQRGVAARDGMLEPVLAEAVRWTLDAWLVLHDDLRKLPMIRLVADHLSTVLPHLLRDGHLPT